MNRNPTLSRTLLNVGWRYLLGHPWQSVLMIVGITLGVAVAVAIDLANASAGRAFDLSTEAVAGRSTHQIVGGPNGLDEQIYVQLRRQGRVQAAAPVVTEYISSPQLGNRPLQLLAVDPFAEPPFRDYLVQDQAAPANQLAPFLTQPGALLISTDLAKRYNLLPSVSGAPVLTAHVPISIEIAGQVHPAFIAGLLQPADDLGRRALGGIVLADIATGQELTGRTGKLDRIDLILSQDSPLLGPSADLPSQARLIPVGTRTGAIEQMTSAFRTNLTALSLLALLVGLFLIYNTITFSVVQRRSLFGTLRCLGVTRREVFTLVLSEALTIGVIGSILGLILGVLLGQGAVRAVTQTINDLYFILTVRGVQVPASSLIKGAMLGILATLLTAAPPAWEAASVPPRQALSRSSLEGKARRVIFLIAIAGLLLSIAGAGLLALPTRNLVLSFAGTFAIIIGFAMLTPIVMNVLMRSAAGATGRLWGALGRMAPRTVINAASRTSVAIAALMVAVSVTIGVSIMVNSFRHTVVVWLEQTLQGDIYVSAPGATETQTSIPIEPSVIQEIRNWPGVVRVDTLRAATVDSPNGFVQLNAVDNPDYGQQRLYLARDRSPTAIQEALQQGAVLVSEPLARRLDLPAKNATVQLYTDQGPHNFPVVGTYYDYTSSQGTLSMSLTTYRRWWQDDTLTALSLQLAPGIDADNLTRELQDALVSSQRLVIRPNRALRQDVLVIFDRTFAITGALQLLATLVAFIGVLSALLSLLLERQRELGIMRAVGLTIRQLWGLLLLETGLMGAVAGLLAMPTGITLAVILIYIINRRSFGWTLQMQVGPEPFLQALAVAVIAALLAGLYPARRMSEIVTAEALRYE